MFPRTFWVDQVEDQKGQVIQQGTLIDQDHLNNAEVGISDIHLAYRIFQIAALWIGRRLGIVEDSSASHDKDIAAIKTLNSQQDTRLAALEKTTGQHTTDISTMKSKDTTQDSRLSALEPEVAAEVKEVTLTANSNPWPYCTKETAVALTTTRKNTNYAVDVAVKSYSGGRLGDITVSDKLVNGFKLTHDGSAKTVVVSVRVTGGMK